MAKLVTALGVVLIFQGLWIGSFPDHLLSVWDWESRSGLYIAAAIRVIFGLALVLGAPATRYPKGLRFFGALVLLVGLSMPFADLDVWAGLIRWWVGAQGPVFRTVGSFGSLLLGGFLIYASRPKQSVA